MNGTQPRGKVARMSATKKFPSLNRVLKYRNEAVIVNFQNRMGLSRAEAEVLFCDTLKFLWLSNQFGQLGPPRKVDDGWHHFILFTMDYRKFCLKYFGRFLHHRPWYPGDPPEDVPARAQRLYLLVREHLGPDMSVNWQPENNDQSMCKDFCKCPG